MMAESIRLQAPEPRHFEFQLVPVKTQQRDGIVLSGLTKEMYDAFWKAFDKAYEHRGHYESTNIAYNAMLAAAPQTLEDARRQWAGERGVLIPPHTTSK